MFDQAMSDEMIRKAAPSVFATHAAPSVSERYAYIPTYPVLRMMRVMGLECVSADEGRKKSPDGREFAMHVLRFRKPEAEALYRDRTTPLGHLIPEVIVRNSHDRTSPLNFSGGMRRKVCMNGLYVSDAAFGANVRHVGKSVAEQVQSGTHRVVGSFARIISVAEDWNGIEMSPELARRFATTALGIRGTSLVVEPSEVLKVWRPEDRSPTLWTLFNRAQENLMRGNVRGQTERGQSRRINRITSLATEVDFNRKLWSAAADMAKEIRGELVAA